MRLGAQDENADENAASTSATADNSDDDDLYAPRFFRNQRLAPGHVTAAQYSCKKVCLHLRRAGELLAESVVVVPAAAAVSTSASALYYCPRSIVDFSRGKSGLGAAHALEAISRPLAATTTSILYCSACIAGTGIELYKAAHALCSLPLRPSKLKNVSARDKSGLNVTYRSRLDYSRLTEARSRHAYMSSRRALAKLSLGIDVPRKLKEEREKLKIHPVNDSET